MVCLNHKIILTANFPDLWSRIDGTGNLCRYKFHEMGKNLGFRNFFMVLIFPSVILEAKFCVSAMPYVSSMAKAE